LTKKRKTKKVLMVRVAVIGAAGGIGQALSLSLKSQLSPDSTLLLYDVVGVRGVAADLSHIDTQVKIEWAQGTIPPTKRCPALANLTRNADVIVVVAGRALAPGQDKDKHKLNRQELFDANAGILLDIVQTTASVTEDACFLIVTNPVNSMVPIAAEALKKLGKYNKNKLFGITSLDVMRATTFLNSHRDPVHVTKVPVIGAHSGPTIVPLFSQTQGLRLEPEEQRAMTRRVQDGGNEVLEAKEFKGTATLSIAFATARFVMRVIRALRGDFSSIEFSYVDTDGGDYPSRYMAIPIALGRGGIAARLPIGPINQVEQETLDVCLPELQRNIEDGLKWAKSKL
jgi:malate dehydrogenase